MVKASLRLFLVLVTVNVQNTLSMQLNLRKVPERLVALQPSVVPPIHMPENSSLAAKDMCSLFKKSEEIFRESKKNKFAHVSPQGSFLQVSALLECSLAPNKMFPQGWCPSVGCALFYHDLNENKVPDGLPNEYEHDETKNCYAYLAHLWLKKRFLLEHIGAVDQEYVDLCNSLVEPHVSLDVSPHNLDYWEPFIHEIHASNGEKIINTPAARYFMKRDLSGETPTADLWHSRVQALAQQKEVKKGSFKYQWFVAPYRNNRKCHTFNWGFAGSGYYTYEDAAGKTHKLSWYHGQGGAFE